jgi:hypothetical protein
MDLRLCTGRIGVQATGNAEGHDYACRHHINMMRYHRPCPTDHVDTSLHPVTITAPSIPSHPAEHRGIEFHFTRYVIQLIQIITENPGPGINPPWIPRCIPGYDFPLYRRSKGSASKQVPVCGAGSCGRMRKCKVGLGATEHGHKRRFLSSAATSFASPLA